MLKLSSLAIRWIIFILIIIALWVAYAVYNNYYVFTSDAYINGKAVGISSETLDKVTKVFAHEGMHVKKGDILFTTDPRAYQLQLQKDMASLQTAKNDRAQIVASIAAAKAEQKAAFINLQHTKATWQHMNGVARAAFSEQTVKDAKFEYDNAAALYNKSVHDIAVLQKQLGPKGQAFPEISQAVTAINLDRYNLSKTVVRAPADGIITNQYLLPGAVVGDKSPLFAIVEPNHFWVTARFKEGALRHIKIGDKVSIYLKMYGSHKFTGTVTDIGYGVNRRQASSTVMPSSLPYLEQTEDWIQLQQRFPVTITLDPAPANMPYRIGGSARVFVKRS